MEHHHQKQLEDVEAPDSLDAADRAGGAADELLREQGEQEGLGRSRLSSGHGSSVRWWVVSKPTFSRPMAVFVRKLSILVDIQPFTALSRTRMAFK